MVWQGYRPDPKGSGLQRGASWALRSVQNYEIVPESISMIRGYAAAITSFPAFHAESLVEDLSLPRRFCLNDELRLHVSGLMFIG